MRRILLVFATREGQTEKIAQYLCTAVESLGASVDLVAARDKRAVNQLNLSDYDLLVFGASMHAGGLEKELVQFVSAHVDQIQTRPRALFVVLLSAAVTPDQDRHKRQLALQDAHEKINAQLSVDFNHHEMIAGALTYSRYSWPIRWVMRRIAGQAGGDTDTSRDYEYTDWQQVGRYASRLVDTPLTQLR